MKQPLPWAPKTLIAPPITLNVASAWKGIESALPDLIRDFRIVPRVALEFGCEYGYSAASLGNHFAKVVTVDSFEGDSHSGLTGDGKGAFERARRNLKPWDNVYVVSMPFKDFSETVDDSARFDLIHVDIEHTLPVTKSALEWAVKHAPVVIAHDTRSFPEVMQACGEIAEEHGRLFYEWPEHHGLGILCTEAPHE